ncbi:hypothetical protein [Bifidobacterium lemurum]|uniref:hypothetical protein n=1 Tax=Bifidobacterium lemurum TaxID=1603886 RepID=UPI0011609E15|nr:hypothetical protein [Bifidobacterium lemurum]QOL33812.1 hypothetical protein BL8807_08510 [Bifidobacterium lemurum]
MMLLGISLVFWLIGLAVSGVNALVFAVTHPIRAVVRLVATLCIVIATIALIVVAVYAYNVWFASTPDWRLDETFWVAVAALFVGGLANRGLMELDLVLERRAYERQMRRLNYSDAD